jgi:hypothetical protein
MKWTGGVIIGLAAFGGSAFVGSLRLRAELDRCERSGFSKAVAEQKRAVDDAFDAGRRFEQVWDADMCDRLPRKALAQCIAPIASGSIVECRQVDGMRCVCGKEPKP